ncbi:MAG: flagellar export chaperone FlgN [Actinomycetota bacterium]
MKRSELLILVGRGLNADLVDYRELKGLLASQFDAALHHRSEELGQIAASVAGLAEIIEGRRQDRVELLDMLLEGDPEPSMAKVLEQLPAGPRQMLQGWWEELEGLARECKEQNARVCRLMTDQHEIMKRVLGGEADTYAPA